MGVARLQFVRVLSQLGKKGKSHDVPGQISGISESFHHKGDHVVVRLAHQTNIEFINNRTSNKIHNLYQPNNYT